MEVEPSPQFHVTVPPAETLAVPFARVGLSFGDSTLDEQLRCTGVGVGGGGVGCCGVTGGRGWLRNVNTTSPPLGEGGSS